MLTRRAELVEQPFGGIHQCEGGVYLRLGTTRSCTTSWCASPTSDPAPGPWVDKLARNLR